MDSKPAVLPLGQSGERQALNPYAAGALEGGKQNAFATEKHALQAAGQLDVVIDARGEGHQAAGTQAQGFLVQFLADDRATGMHEGQPVTFQALQDETFATEEAGAQALAETDANPGAICGAEKA